jgi:hypothetical protein
MAIDDYFERRGIMATMISEVYDAFIALGYPGGQGERPPRPWLPMRAASTRLRAISA